MKFFNAFVVLMVALFLTAVEAKSPEKVEMLGFSQFMGQTMHACPPMMRSDKHGRCVPK